MSISKRSPLSMFISNKVGSSLSGSPPPSADSGQSRSRLHVVRPGLLITDRKVRDSGSLVVMLAFLGFLGYIIWDGLLVKEADINMIVHGHDSYGNICGRNNKPIKFVEKSGRNYTTKPFTKYTLINAQFERYTLDPGRSREGELYYVKETGSGPQIQTVPEVTSRIKRSPTVYFDGEKLRKNQTLLNELKATLMYQYPPMYGYSPSRAHPSDSSSHQNSLVLSNRLHKPRGDLSTAQTENNYASALRPQASPAQLNTNRPNGGASNFRFTGTSLTTPMTVIFDDHLNDSDRYDHMLVKPFSTNSVAKTRTPEVLSQSEIGSQLLYLTECVDSCPADHVELIFYRCMPKNWRFSLFPNAINVTRTFIDDIITDLTHCYRELIYIFSFALAVSLVLLILLRFLASFIIWSCLLLLIGLFISMAGYSWINYYYQIIDLNNLMPHDTTYAEKLASSDKWLFGSIFLTFLAFATIGTVIFMRKRILMVTSLFRESGKAIADMPFLLLQPLLTFTALCGVTALWAFGLICLQSMKSPVIDVNTGFVVYKAEFLYKIMKWYHIFAFLWVCHFAIACQHYVIGASVSKWYFSQNRYRLHSPIGTSVSELILYYMGSVALGSLLVAIFKVLRIVTRQIQFLVQRNCMTNPVNHGANMGAPQSSLNTSSISTSCCGSFSYVWRLFIWFFDNIVMIINRDAYVEIAIHGHSFLSGAQRALQVLASNPLKLLAIKSVGNLLLVVAKVCVVFGTISMAIVLLDERTIQLNYAWSPIVVSAIYSYIVAHWFLSVYEMVIDALFICYCEDYERIKNRNDLTQAEETDLVSRILGPNPVH